MGAVRPGMGIVSPRGAFTEAGAGCSVTRKKLWVQLEAGKGIPAAVSETGGKGLAKKCACNVKEEEDLSFVVGAEVLAGRMVDLGSPAHNGGAVATRSVTVATG